MLTAAATTQNPFPSPSDVATFAVKHREESIQYSMYWLRSRFNYFLDRRRNNEQGISMHVGNDEQDCVDAFMALLREKGWEASYKDKQIHVTAVVAVVAGESDAPRDLFHQIIPTPQEAMDRLASRRAEIDKRALDSLIGRVKDALASGADVPIYGDEPYVVTEVIALLEERGWKVKMRGDCLKVRKEMGRRWWWQC